MKKYIPQQVYDAFRDRYDECVRMLNGLERTLERHLDGDLRRWPADPEPSTLNPEP